MSRLLNPEGAAKSVAAHMEYLRREEIYIAAIYRDYEGVKLFETALQELGVNIADVKAVAEAVGNGS